MYEVLQCFLEVTVEGDVLTFKDYPNLYGSRPVQTAWISSSETAKRYTESR